MNRDIVPPSTRARRLLRTLLPGAVLSHLLLLAAPVHAVPQAHILRAEAAPGSGSGARLTTLVEVIQPKRLADALAPCAAMQDAAALECMATAMEDPNALYSSFAFPEPNAVLTVRIGADDKPATFVEKTRWSDGTDKPRFGTAWLLVVDAGAAMAPSLEDAKSVAKAFVDAMRPNDAVKVVSFGEEGVLVDSAWTADKAAASAALASIDLTRLGESADRHLADILTKVASGGFVGLSRFAAWDKLPLHQAMVVLSSGSTGKAPSNDPAAATALAAHLTKGRFPEGSSPLPKLPLPTISVWFPGARTLTGHEDRMRFMQDIATADIGGTWSLVRPGDGRRAVALVSAVRGRFDKMHVVTWDVPALAPGPLQSIQLAFVNTLPLITSDATFSGVPLAFAGSPPDFHVPMEPPPPPPAKGDAPVTVAATPPPGTGGCGACTAAPATGPGAPAAGLALMALLLVRRRRRDVRQSLPRPSSLP